MGVDQFHHGFSTHLFYLSGAEVKAETPKFSTSLNEETDMVYTHDFQNHTNARILI